MRKTVAILLLAFALVACQQKEEPKQQWPAIPPQVAPGKSLEEEKMLRDVLAKDPKNLKALIQLGNILMDSERFKEAADVYSKAIEIDPKNVDVRVDMGTCLRNLGSTDLAIKEFRKAQEIDLKHVYAHLNLGVALADKKDFKGAASEYEKALTLNPNLPNAQAIKQEIQTLKTMK